MEKSRNVEPSDFLWILSVVGDGVNPALYSKLKKRDSTAWKHFPIWLWSLRACFALRWLLIEAYYKDRHRILKSLIQTLPKEKPGGEG